MRLDAALPFAKLTLRSGAEAMTEANDERRAFLMLAGAGALALACRKDRPTTVEVTAGEVKSVDASVEGPKEDDVGAVEDLMREHGVIRRVLVVYRETAIRLRDKPEAVPMAELQKAGKLIRTFAEDYHEKQLEEAHLFPAVRSAGGTAAAAIDPLVAQHQRGREITDYVLAVTAKGLGKQAATPLAKALEGFARMYDEHAAFEDTIVFPAWKKTLSKKQLAEMGELFEAIEHKTFGKDGFDDAVEQIGQIEKAFGIDLPGMMPPLPPPVGNSP
jgi:hemerythrin-like domain-containing protein